MADDITSRVLQLFKHRLENDPKLSSTTVNTLLEGQQTNDFGEDEEILTELIDTIEDEQ